MCQFKQSFNRYTLRGLCLDSRHDTVYFLERTPGAMPFFKGLSSSVIRWNTTLETWVLNHLRYTAPAYLDEDPVVINLGYPPIGRVRGRSQTTFKRRGMQVVVQMSTGGRQVVCPLSTLIFFIFIFLIEERPEVKQKRNNPIYATVGTIEVVIRGGPPHLTIG